MLQITIRDFMGYRRQEESGQNVFDFIDCSNQFGEGCNDEFPELDWVCPQPASPTYQCRRAYTACTCNYQCMLKLSLESHGQ